LINPIVALILLAQKILLNVSQLPQYVKELKSNALQVNVQKPVLVSMDAQLGNTNAKMVLALNLKLAALEVQTVF